MPMPVEAVLLDANQRLRRGRAAAIDVAKGLHYLHSHRIVHFDLKSRKWQG